MSKPDSTKPDSPGDETDPVLIRRRRIEAVATWAKRAGWLLFAVAVVGFFSGMATRFEPWLVETIVLCLGVGSALLAPAIVFSFAVAATDREERGGSYGH